MESTETTEEQNKQTQYTSHQTKTLKLAIENTLNQICNNVTVEKFHNAFEDISSLEGMSNKIFKLNFIVKEKVKEKIMTDIEQLFHEEDFDKKFCELNAQVTADSRNGETVAWRPSGNVDADIRSHLMLIKLKQKADLQLLLTEKHKSISYLKSMSEKVQDETHILYNKLLELKNDLNKTTKQYKEELKTISSI